MVNTAVIAEYNPFHLGHKYHIEQAKKKTNADIVTVIMSGSFVQRAEPALFSKEARVRMALLSGADIVLELPFINVLQSAERYAMGAVYIADIIGASYLAFGSECGDISKIKEAARTVSCSEINEPLQKILLEGASFPAARAAAMKIINPSLADIISKPNNILGVEYVKAINCINSSTEPVTVERVGAGHDEDGICEGNSSATQIRKILKAGGNINGLVPECVQGIINEEIENGRYMPNTLAFDRAVLARLRAESQENISKATDCAEGLEYRIISALQKNASPQDIADAVKSKRYTHSRIRRILLSAYLGIDKADYAMPPYIRLLGLKKEASKYWLEIKKNCTLPVIERIAKQRDNIPSVLEREIIADEIWGSFTEKPIPYGENYKKFPITI